MPHPPWCVKGRIKDLLRQLPAQIVRSYLLRDVPSESLHSDTRFFTLMGEDSLKVAYFRAFVAAMQKQNPDFGRECYLDSIPLPNDIDNNPFNALSCHGVS